MARLRPRASDRRRRLQAGSSYFEYCDRAQRTCDEDSAGAFRALTTGLRSALSEPGSKQRLQLELPNERRVHRYDILITTFHHRGRVRALVTFEDVTEAIAELRRGQLLSRLTELFVWQNDTDALLERVTKLAVSWLGDAGWIDAVEPDGSLRRQLRVDAGGGVVRPDGCPVLRSPAESPAAVRAALESGKPTFVADPRREAPANGVATKDACRPLDESARSAIVLPLMAHERLVAVLTVVRMKAANGYDDPDPDVCELVAGRIGLALAHAQQRERAIVEARERTRAMAIVSHDLRNELSTIHMAAQLMRDTPLDEKTRREHLKRIERKAESLSRLVHDLLDVSRMEEGRFPLRLEGVDVMELMQEIVWSLEPLAQQRDITLRAVGIGHVSTALIDRERVRQALSNLVQNAMKFTALGGSVQIDAERENGDVRFAVRDNGCGIPSEDLAHVFDPYWQKACTSVDGAGLGLSIVRGIVEAHGGRIWVESAPDAGSAFCFTLPAERAAEPAPVVAARPASVAKASPLRRLIEEMRRRHVFHVIVIYVTSCCAVIQGAEVVLPVLGMPARIVNALVLGSISGLPVTTILAWLFEVKRDRGAARRTMLQQ